MYEVAQLLPIPESMGDPRSFCIRLPHRTISLSSCRHHIHATMPSDTEGTLTDAQNTYLKSLEPDFKAYVLKDANGDKSTAEKAAKKWKDDQTSEILAKIKKEYPYPSNWPRDTTDGKVKSVSGILILS